MLRLNLSQRQEIKAELSVKQQLGHYQKILQTRLLKIEQSLVHGEFPDTIRGIEGLKKADELLKKKKLTGILVGGALKELCKEGNIKKRLQEHKDIDVMVLSDEKKIQRFEGGVDRRIPKTQRREFTRESGSISKEVTRWENGNGVKLIFGINDYKRYNEQPGLIIPDIFFYRTLKVNEVMNVLSSAKGFEDIEIPEKTLKIFEETLLQGMKHNANMDIRKQYLSGPIVDGKQKQLIGKNDLYYHEIDVIRSFASDQQLENIIDKASTELSLAMQKRGIEKS